jgi:hypothetical protein
MFGIKRSNHREKNVPPALVWRRLAGPPLDDGAELHLLQIDIEPGTAQLVGADQAERTDAGEFGRCCDDDDRLAAVAGLGEFLFGRGRIASPPQKAVLATSPRPIACSRSRRKATRATASLASSWAWR